MRPGFSTMSLVFEGMSLLPYDGRAVAVFGLGAERRGALADALSWRITSRFQADALEAETVLELRGAGALADRLDEHRDVEGLASVRVNADEVRLLIEAVVAYLSERDPESYQPPEHRARLDELNTLIDPLFDLAFELDKADKVLGGSTF
jgi:hypothetical protein